MANPYKGEVAVELGGEGDGRRTLVFRLGINELIELQDALGITDDEKFLAALDQLRSLRKVRLIVLHAMRYAQKDATEAEAGEVITELGIERVGKLIREVLKWALPQPEGKAVSGKGASASPGARPS
jgi:hypothetical protein